jgi:NTP pyrophosphatase (non-canonical NTP hydrolase)
MGHRYPAVSAGTAVVWVLDPLLLGEEVGELFKAVRKSHAGIAYSEPHDADAAGELADVLIVMCAVANRLGVDLEDAVRSKEAINASRRWD